MSGAEHRRRRAATALWLARVASNRPGVVQRAAKHFGSLDAALDAPLPALRARLSPKAMGTGRATASPSRSTTTRPGGRDRVAAEAALEASRFVRALAAPPAPPRQSPRAGWLVVTYDDDLYPPRLRSLFDPPPALFVAGDDGRRRLLALAEAPAVAVVGTRAPSSYGREMARLLGGDLARAGVVVVSGVALGIDVCAQVAALEAAGAPSSGAPPSVGVLGCGLDIVHPRSNAAAFRALRERGLLISEFWPGTPPSVWRFPARNRLIAGLSRAVVVVEGSRRSGSRITAEFAVEAGRDVLAVPGEAGRRLSEAPHHLIRQGAHLCEAADDVLAVLGLERTYGGSRPAGQGAASPPGTEPVDGGAVAGREAAASGVARRAAAGQGGQVDAVLEALRDAPAGADELAARLALEVRVVSAALSALEVEGLAERAAGGVYRVVR